jgi:UDP-N-acetylglucosamine 2-epimerase (non-hydrolysing)
MMSRAFIEEFSLPEPDYDLTVGSGSHAYQTATTMLKIERLFRRNTRPSVCMVPGDTNSAIGAALGSIKVKVPVAHLEAGLRCREEFMPEEINRKLIDHCSQLLFAPTKNANSNLIAEGIPQKMVELTGDTMYDLFLLEGARITNTLMPIGTTGIRKYIVMTLHREQNTTNPRSIKEILLAIKDFGIPTIFPVHPRTKLVMKQSGLLHKSNRVDNLILVDPLGYHSMMKLIRDCQFVMTDSGGMQKEAFMSAVPCLTLRGSTEWEETTKVKANLLMPSIDRDLIVKAMNVLYDNRKVISQRIKQRQSLFGDGEAARRIVDALEQRFPRCIN